MGNNNKYTYEDKFETVDNEIRKRYYKWHLHALAWLDFDDVSQIIRAHIYKKWDQWDQQRPIEPWVNKIISNQLKNILRNNYSNFARPCISCKHNQSKEQSSGQIANLCSFLVSTTPGLSNLLPRMEISGETRSRSSGDTLSPIRAERGATLLVCARLVRYCSSSDEGRICT